METALTHPKLRPLDVKLVQQDGQRYLHLRDPLSLSGKELLVPVQLSPLLSLCDGTRDQEALRIVVMLLHGLTLSQDQVNSLLQELDDALLLEGPRYQEARAQALGHYRNAPHRPLALAGTGYPADPVELEEALSRYCTDLPPENTPGQDEANSILGLLSPHIDYHRGHRVYARTWQGIGAALEDCDLVILLGTDHAGGDGQITLTRQSYATPWGPIPTDLDLVEELIGGLGEEAALEEEVHHIREHSIELAAVWLHYSIRRARGESSTPSQLPKLLPVLCGSMGTFIQGDESPDEHPGFRHLIDTLRGAIQTRKTLVVAAGDLAHVGPAFGDPKPWTQLDRASLRAADQESLTAICSGDAEGFLRGLKLEGDRRRVCGLTPIYLALKLIGSQVIGEVTGYDQCPADEMGGSLVSIAGVVWRKPS